MSEPPSTDTVPEDPEAPGGRDPIGSRIGRFSITGRIGAGGMGVVFEAHDEQLDRKIALKVLSRELGLSANARTRLIREAMTLARLSHPNVVAVFDAGVHADEVYIAMEHVPGQTIGRWLQAAPRSWGEILQVFIGAGEGLAAMHASGLVHRDFKPDNALVDESGRARLIDFGLARRMDAEKEGEGEPRPPETETISAADSEASLARLTRTGALVGTVAYMSPEQFTGQPITAASDQFSFCVSLFEAVYGCPPFEGDTRHGRALSVLHGQMTTPEDRAIAPDELWHVLARGLRREPEERWPDMAELLRALRALADSYSPDIEDPVRRRQELKVMAFFTALAVVSSIAMFFAGSRAMNARPRDEFVSGAVLFAVLLLVIGLLRSSWKERSESRRLLWLLVTVAGSYVINSGIGWLAGRSLYHTHLGSATIMVAVSLFASALVLRVLLLASALGLISIGLMLLDPPNSSAYLSALNGLVVGLVVAYLPRRRVQRWIRTAAKQGSTASTMSRSGMGHRATGRRGRHRPQTAGRSSPSRPPPRHEERH